MFGKNWWCPMFESTLVPLSERVFLLKTLVGEGVYLAKDRKGEIRSVDGLWSARSLDSSQTEISGPSGWRYLYSKGRLIEASSGECRLRWKYNGGRFESLSELGNGVVASVEYDGQGVAKALMLGDQRYDLTIQNVPIVSFVNGIPLISGYERTLASASVRDEWWKFPIKFTEKGEYVMGFSSSFGGAEDIYWEPGTGRVLRGGDWIYSVEPATVGADGKIEKQALISRRDPTGAVESYVYDSRTGVSEHRRPNGVLVLRTYFVSQSPTFGKIRKYQELVGGVERTVWTCNYDDQGRAIRETCGDAVTTWTYSPEGRVVAEEQKQKEQLVLKRVYDPQNRLVSVSRPDFEFRYDYDAGRTVVQRLVNGQLQVASVFDKNWGAPVQFLAKSGGIDLESGSMNSSIPGKELDQLKAIALRAIEKQTNKLNE